MWITKISIRQPVFATMVMVALMVLGIFSYKGLGVESMPNVSFPFAAIEVVYPGASPEAVENDITRPIEDIVNTVSGVKTIRANSWEGKAGVYVEFELSTNMDKAMQDMRDKIALVRPKFPREAKEPFIARAEGENDQPIVSLSFSSDKRSLRELSTMTDQILAKRFQGVPGVGQVRVFGTTKRQMLVSLRPADMRAQGVGVDEVMRAIQNTNANLPAGRLSADVTETLVRVEGKLKEAQEFNKIIVARRANGPVYLDQVADVIDGEAEEQSISRVNGKRAVSLDITKVQDANVVEVGNGILNVVENLRKTLPDDIKIKVLDSQSERVQSQLDNVKRTIIEGAILTMVIVFFFLHSWRSTIITGLTLPISVLASFIAMKAFGFTLNFLTLMALSLCIGLLIDDAIVVRENIVRHLHMGKTPMQAALEAADEIGMAVIATTFALVAVFLPTAFMGGIPGKFFKQFGWAAVLAVLASLVVARLLTPMMAAHLLKQTDKPQQEDGWIMQRYMKTMRWCLNNRGKTALAAGAFFVGSIMLVGLLPTGFVPPADRGQTMVNLELPPGSTLAETRAIAERARLAIMEVKPVTHVFSSIGGGSSGDAFAPGAAAEARRAVLTITTRHRNDRKESMPQIDDMIREKLSSLPGARFTVGPPDTGVKMQLVLRSEDPVALIESARKVERDLRTLHGIGNVTSSASLVRPEIIVRPDFAKAADLGVTANAIGETVRVATAGDYDFELTKMNLAERQVPIRVKLPDSVRADLDAIGRLTVPGRNGPVMLANVASITMESGPAQIDRLNRSRNVTLDVELGSRSLGELDEEARQLPSMKNLPPTVTRAELGDTQEMQNLFASFGIAMLIGVLCIYGVLVLLFHDFLQPLTILAALPLSIGGAFVALLVTQKALSMPSMIGLIMLMGIVTKNSILLVDYAILARAEGMSRFDALVDACHKRSRPILMTTIAMGAGRVAL